MRRGAKDLQVWSGPDVHSHTRPAGAIGLDTAYLWTWNLVVPNGVCPGPCLLASKLLALPPEVAALELATSV